MTLHQGELLEVNEFLVLDLIRERERMTRPEISRALGLAPSTVGRIVARLVAEGAVVEERQTTTGPGRPPVHLSFNRQAGSVLAVDLGGTLCRGALADLGGGILERDVRPTHGDGRPFDTLLAMVSTLRRIANDRSLPARALAIGVPATIDPESLLGTSGPAVEWEGFELVPRLARQVEIPFAVENDVNLAALAQAWRGDARHLGDFAVLSIGTGVGGGIVSGGRLLKGRHNAGGELGGFVLDRSALHGPPPPGGAFEALASGPALVHRAREKQQGLAGPSSPLLAEPITPERIFEAAAADDPVAREVIDELVERVAMVMIGVVAVTDPAAIILDGSVGRSMAPYVGRLEDLLRGRVLALPRVTTSALGADGTLIGAIAAALQLAWAHSAPGLLFGSFSVAGGERDRHAHVGAGPVRGVGSELG